MAYATSDSLTSGIVNFRSVFESMPGIHALLLPDAPRYTIAAVTDDYLVKTSRTREQLIGVGLFEAFPPNPDDPQLTGEQDVAASFRYIIEHKKPHQLPAQRYDVENKDGVYEESWWSATNKPVPGEDGEVLYIIHSVTDITAEVKARQREDGIKDIEKAFQLFMQAPVTIAIVKGDDFVIELANESMLKVWGRGKEVIGKPLLVAIPELEGQGFIEQLDTVRKTGKPYYAYESPATIIQNGKAETSYFDFVYQPYYENSLQTVATGIIGVAHDVTEQVLARKRVAEVTERLNFRNALFEAQNEVTPDGVLIVNANGEMLLHNNRFIEIWKMPEEIMQAKDDGAALQHAQSMLVDPEGFIKRVMYLYNNRKEKSYDLIPFKDGRMIERNGTPITAENGLYYGWAWYFRDITARIQQEQKFRNVVEQATDPILILKGEDMVLEVANKALLDLWKTNESAIGKPFLEILPEMKDQGFIELLQKVYHTGQPFQGVEIPAFFEEENGNKRTVYSNFTYQPYREADGSISGVLVMASDVTGQVEAKRKLVESEKNLRNTILQAPVAMCILRGPQFVVEIANERMFELWGKDEAAMLYKPVFEGLPEVRDQGLEELLHHVYTTGETSAANEMPVTLTRNGSRETRYTNFVYHPFREGDGSIAGVISIAIEVTGQVTARKKIEESEQRFRTLANSISQLAWIANADGWIYWYNNRWYDYTGTTLEEMQGWGWEKVHHPDHKQRVVDFVKEAWEKDEPFELTFPLRGKDGRYRWFLTRAYPVLDEGGKILQWIGTNTDIDEQKQLEVSLEQKVHTRTTELENQRNLFDNILKNSSNGISVTEMIRDENGSVVDARTILANDAAVKFTGLPKDVYLTKTANELDPGILKTPYGLTCLNTLETGEPSFTQYFLDITGRWLELTISKMDNDHLIHIFTDITPIKEAQMQLERTVAELKRSNVNLEEFAYAASHDLKEPVRKIHFFADRLKTVLKDRLEDEEKKSFERMETATKRMSSLIDDLLAYSQVSLRPRMFEQVSLNQIIDLVLNDLDLEMEEKKATISVGKLFT
ncbi:MAG TPA: PAS domain-containing protein, partial [Flavisolibacter sp.]|nr:PAS domain-containing protein [Flavisolibacter sp.]